jgi:nucleoside-diphosphate-sugar epimerase
MKIVVTGAAGLVGQNLTPRLLAKGHRVVCLDKNAANLRLLATLNPTAEALCVDLSEPGSWQEQCAGADAVVDLKAQITTLDHDVFTRHNVAAAQNVLEACRRHGVGHLVHLSSSVVISVADDGYTNSKKQGEQIVAAGGVPYTILRPPLLYGCFDVKHLGYLANFLRKTPVVPIPGSGRYMRQPLYVLDLCQIILRCLERGPSGRVHNVIGHERIDFIDILRAIARETRLRRLLLRIPLPLFRLLLRVHAALVPTPAFTTEQLEALIAGDDFPVEAWAQEFGVAYTPFAQALHEIYASPESRYNREMESPH